MKSQENFFIVFRSEQQRVSPEIRQVYLELSTHCNLSCRGCARNSMVDFKKSHFTPAMMRRLLPMLEDLRLDRIVLLGFGEALCNPHVRELLAALRKLDAKIVLVTNSAFLTDTMSAFLVSLPLDEIYLSWDDDINGGDSTIRPGITAGDFRRNIEALVKFRAASGGRLPVIGMEMVAVKSNYRHMAGTIAYGHSIGIETFIVTNLFPYQESMDREILYDKSSKPDVNLAKLLRNEIKRHGVRTANQKASINRACPFIEKGTLFITARGDIAPCPELAHTHPAWYFGYHRMHNSFILGNIKTDTLYGAWEKNIFTETRKNFLYYDYPDCSYCYRPDMCYKRTVEGSDCFGNETPCGECLWAKGIVICP
jgi:Fe-coproporphyrin III synthase